MSGQGARRGPRRVAVTIPPALVEVLEALAALSGRTPVEQVESMVLEELAEARGQAVVQEAVRARRGGAGLHVLDGGRS